MPKIRLVLRRPLVLPQNVEFDTERITLGRSKSCTCLIEDRFLSRTHAELIAREGRWFIRDCGSANGTFVNGARIDREIEFRYEDVVTIGDTEIRMSGTNPQDEITQVGVDSAPAPAHTPAPTPAPAPAPAPAPPEPEQIPDLVIGEDQVKESAERTMIVHKLALELIGERTMTELFEVIVDHVMNVMNPSRVAIGLIGDDGRTLEVVRFRDSQGSDDTRLTISRTLLSQIVEERKVIAFTDIGSEEDAVPESMVAQGIFSALGAPMVVRGSVLGVLYIDYRLSDRVISEDDAQLAAQIAGVAALKLASSDVRDRRGINKADILDFFRFNEWANARLIEVVRALEPALLTRELGGSHRTIRDVLSHIISSEWVWLERWIGNSPTQAPEWVDSADVSKLVEILAGLESKRQVLFADLPDEKLREPVTYRLLSGVESTRPLVDLMVHVVDHSTYHRGQLASMIRQCGVAPATTSFIEYRQATSQD